jgi:hypothetical protein
MCKLYNFSNLSSSWLYLNKMTIVWRDDSCEYNEVLYHFYKTNLRILYHSVKFLDYALQKTLQKFRFYCKKKNWRKSSFLDSIVGAYTKLPEECVKNVSKK